MSIYVIGNAFFVYKISCEQMCPPNSTVVSSIRNSNLVVNQCSVQPLEVSFSMTRTNK